VAARVKAVRSAALLILVSGVAVAAGGCGTGATASQAELSLRREDLIAVSRALQSTESSAKQEVAATKVAWPLIVNGLPPSTTTIARARIAAAVGSAARLSAPALFEEAQARAITGPGSPIAGLFRTYSGLATRGWRLVWAAIEQIDHGDPIAARFARENVALYIESIYDAHFSLAQIGKKLRTGYRKLGGQAVFGATLTQGEVDALANTYSEATDRLHPHVGVRLGS
jgi:hypothetical protein